MAISKVQPGIAATILIDGQPATEHQDTDDVEVVHTDPVIAKYQASRTVSTYIESESEKTFSIKLSVGLPYGHKKMECSKLGFHVVVDGVQATEVHCPRPWWKAQEDEAAWENEIKGVEEVAKGKRDGTLKEFKFAHISTSMSCVHSTFI